MDTDKGKAIVNHSSENEATNYVFDPAGLRVLVVDDSSSCLMVLEKMLKSCQYEVTTCKTASEALSILRGDKNGFDIVLSDLHMPNMNGLKLLEIVGLEMDLPVVIMSGSDGKEDIIKGIVQGACDYLVKPVKMDAINMLWQHVIRKKRNSLKEAEKMVNDEDNVVRSKEHHDDADHISELNKQNIDKSLKRRKDDRDEGEATEYACNERKQRFVWTQELHKKFMIAVQQLGYDKAVPKKILEVMLCMNVTGITRENIASHLQKYRLYIQKSRDSLKEAEQPFMHPKKSLFEKASSVEVWNLRSSRESRNLAYEQYASLNLPNPPVCADTSQSRLQSLPIQQAGGLERRDPNCIYSTSRIESNSYPMNMMKLCNLALPPVRSNSGENILTKRTGFGGLERPSANSIPGMPLVDSTNQFDPRMPESSSYHISGLPSSLWGMNSGESVLNKIASSCEPERVNAASDLGLPPTDRTNLLDPKILGSTPYSANELPLPLWRTNSGESFLGKTGSPSVLPFIDQPNTFDTKMPESCLYPVTELSTIAASLPLSRTSSGEDYVCWNQGNIAQQSTDNANDPKDKNMPDFCYEALLNSKNLDQDDTSHGPFA